MNQSVERQSVQVVHLVKSIFITIGFDPLWFILISQMLRFRQLSRFMFADALIKSVPGKSAVT